MCEGYGSHSVCVSATALASCYIPVENKVPLGFLWYNVVSISELCGFR